MRGCAARALQTAATQPLARFASQHRPQCRQKRCNSPTLAEVFSNPLVDQYCGAKSSPTGVKYLFDFTRDVTPDKLLASGRYLQRELPARIAQTIRSFDALPYIVAVNPHIAEVLITYVETVEALHKGVRITDAESNVLYTGLVLRLAATHSHLIPALARGLRESKELPGSIAVDQDFLDSFMDSLIGARIARRVITAQHYSLLAGAAPDHIGAFDTRCTPANVLTGVIKHCQNLCERQFGRYPEVEVTGDLDAYLCYIRDHLEYILVELMKPAMRHTCAVHTGDSMPSINVEICKGNALTVVVTDRGGGVPVEDADRMWSYGWQSGLHRQTDCDTPDTAEISELVQRVRQRIHEAAVEPTGVQNEERMAGGLRALRNWVESEGTFGGIWTEREHRRALAAWSWTWGLPVARAYARYLGGDIEAENMPGVGTAMYLTLHSITEDSSIAF